MEFFLIGFFGTIAFLMSAALMFIICCLSDNEDKE